MPAITLANETNLVARGFDERKTLGITSTHLGILGLVAAFVGGEATTRAESAISLVPSLTYLGWYNTGGSYIRAQHYSHLSQPEKILGIGGQSGPSFLGAYSGTKSERTGHLASLLWSTVKTWNTRIYNPQLPTLTSNVPRPYNPQLRELASGADSRIHVTVIDLQDTKSSATDNPALYRVLPSGKLASLETTFMIRLRVGWLMVVNFAICIGCAFIPDWFCFASIAIGIVVNGLIRCILGGRRLTIEHPGLEARSAAQGDGILWVGGNAAEIILLLGSADAVHSITHGSFRLSPPLTSAPLNPVYDPYSSYFGVPTVELDVVYVLLTAQMITQALLIPMASFLGQILFFVTLVVHWAYDLILRWFAVETYLQVQILSELVPQLRPHNNHRFAFGSWPTALVFSLLRLRKNGELRDPRILLDQLEPNDTLVWRMWKAKVVDLLTGNGKPDYPYSKTLGGPVELTDEEDQLFRTLLREIDEARRHAVLEGFL